MNTLSINGLTRLHGLIILKTTIKKALSVFLSWSVFVIAFPISLQASSGSIHSEISNIKKQTGKLRMAVIDLEGMGISQLEAETLTNHMRAVLERSGSVSTVGQNKIRRILSEQGFQKMEGISNEWAIMVGKSVDAGQVIKGSLGKIGENLVVDIRILDVQTGLISASITKAYYGGVDSFIRGVEEIALEIAGSISKLNDAKQLYTSYDDPSSTSKSFPHSAISKLSTIESTVSNKHEARMSSQVKNRVVHSQVHARELGSGIKANSAIILGGSFLSYLVISSIVAVVLYTSKGKPIHKIGSPPAFPDVPGSK